MLCKTLKRLVYSKNGFQTSVAEAGSEVDLPDAMASGLIAAGIVEVEGSEPAQESPEAAKESKETASPEKEPEKATGPVPATTKTRGRRKKGK